ncbi:MAG TPA: glycoside hydrolase family 25 protein [Pyrinomonadaceae bacterium]|nr:glycoside hydrolase family 25 protein [Pyrinomonadaceae bacterium]
MGLLNVVVDISHHNGDVDLMKAKQAGIVGVIHKATQGMSMLDKMYDRNRDKAMSAGLLWGAYHFGTKGDGVSQAEFFLDKVGTDLQTLLVLDYEPNGNATMSLDQAHAFVSHINLKADRFPGLYSGSLIKEQLGNQPADSILSKCFLWIAQYGSQPTNIPKTWSTWTFWQYTDGVAGPPPHVVDGIGKCDRDQFNGSLEELKARWMDGFKT